MNDKTNIQDNFLDQIRKRQHIAAIYTTNGFKMKGRIVAYDQFTLLVEDAQGKQNLVYKSAISTIVRAEPDNR